MGRVLDSLWVWAWGLERAWGLVAAWVPEWGLQLARELG